VQGAGRDVVVVAGSLCARIPGITWLQPVALRSRSSCAWSVQACQFQASFCCIQSLFHAADAEELCEVKQRAALAITGRHLLVPLHGNSYVVS
jgi:hypothetical protein